MAAFKFSGKSEAGTLEIKDDPRFVKFVIQLEGKKDGQKYT